MGSNKGWVRLHRSLLEEDSTFQRLTAIQQIIAIHLILRANHRDAVWYDKNRSLEIPVKRGELITSRSTIKEWFKGDSSITDRKIRTTIVKLENLGFLTKRTTNAYTVLSVVNYDVFQKPDDEIDQQNDQETTSKCPGNDQQTTTNKNDKNEKKKKELREVPESFEITDNLQEWAGENLGSVSWLAVETQKFTNYYQSKGERRKDWNASWRNWMLKAQEIRGEKKPAKYESWQDMPEFKGAY